MNKKKRNKIGTILLLIAVLILIVLGIYELKDDFYKIGQVINFNSKSSILHMKK